MNTCFVPGCGRFTPDPDSLCEVHLRRTARMGLPRSYAPASSPRRTIHNPERHYTRRRIPEFPEAACRGSSWDWVEPPARSPRIVGLMLLTCTRCPHMVECREWAVRNNERGVWGATLDADRAEIRRAAKAGAL